MLKVSCHIGSIYGPLTQVLAALAVLPKDSLTQAIHSSTKSTLLWMDKKSQLSLSEDRGTHRSRPSKSMDKTSLIHSFILIGTYLSLFKYLVRLTTQCIHWFWFFNPYPGIIYVQATTVFLIQVSFRIHDYVWYRRVISPVGVCMDKLKAHR